jgi:hypothetical protein
MHILNSSSNFFVLLSIDAYGKLTKLYDRRGDSNFAIVNFPYTCSNIQLSPACGEYISTDSICRGLFYVRSVFETGSTTGTQVDVTGISTVSFDVSVLQVLWPLQ